MIGWAERVADFFKRFLDGKDGIMIVMENVFVHYIYCLVFTNHKFSIPNQYNYLSLSTLIHIICDFTNEVNKEKHFIMKK